ncbi:DUF2269 family protein [Magnetococcus sp. PR-3]|uniref:DUF2269 family protein n=1 Tax=Magnetococcus sp. PR-3 TaxID=3120355 RepID=UPI002FCE25DD
MLDPLFLKWIHILSMVLLFGTGLGTAFHGLACNLSQNRQAMAVGNRNVVMADWLFTTPAVLVQPVTGVLLAQELGWDLTEGWIFWSLVLYGLAGACWLPVVWLQLRMRRLSNTALKTGAELPQIYHRYFRLWFALGWPAFAAMISIVWLMVFKPSL